MSASDMLATIALQLGILAEEVLADVGAALDLEYFWYSPSTVPSSCLQQAVGVAASSGSQSLSPRSP
jgi:hypothetical protein